MISPPGVAAVAHGEGLSDQIGANRVDSVGGDGLGGVEHKHFAFYDVGKMGFPEAAFA